MSIGLQRGRVLLASYSTKWPKAYEQERLRLLNVAGDVITRIEHIGSTSVPGIQAKPIIDIGLEVDSLEALETLAKRLPPDVYQYFGERDISGDFFFTKGSQECRTHYIHVSLVESDRLERYLIFRNALRHDSLLARQYDQLKQRLVLEFPNDRKTYSKQKGEWIEEVIRTQRPR
ncbi:GrpB family protein [Reinekea blandensis]|uniref:GrpB family protein n=1 Tax=Reinekea blandensis MED297 TaxID=314283 RepID=A4BH00_9GAMM|nr:GrpB family protein [Reinekea blandensis]EAR08646.1 hypothetical protein MED297_03040 [Reinekea sp. MED297] [Reinekea blandensis MED297]